jgi:NAD(P)H dehydrogenase (quinone)
VPRLQTEPNGTMHVLIVSALPEDPSLGAALRAVAVEALTGAGHTVEHSDLYAMDFDPVLRPGDYGSATDGIRPLTDRAGAAMRAASVDPVIVAEQAKVTRADVVVFVFPMWWFGLPAILKGWFDRVFLQGYAFGLAGPGGPRLRYGDGGLAGKRAFTIITAGDRPASFEPRGVNGHVDELLFPLLHGTLWYCGMAPLEPVFVPGVGYPNWQAYEDVVASIRRRLAGLDDEVPIPYRSLGSGDYGRDRLLRADLRPGESGLDVHRADR